MKLSWRKVSLHISMALSYHTSIMQILSGEISQVLWHRWNSYNLSKSLCKKDFESKSDVSWGPDIGSVGPNCMRGMSVINIVLNKMHWRVRSLNISMCSVLQWANNMVMIIPWTATCPKWAGQEGNGAKTKHINAINHWTLLLSEVKRLMP